MRKLIQEGDWGHSVYKAYLDIGGDYEHLRDTTTSAFCVCFDNNGKVALANNDPVGGYVEPGESIEDALKREVLEEGGIKLEKWKYFGH